MDPQVKITALEAEVKRLQTFRDQLRKKVHTQTKEIQGLRAEIEGLRAQVAALAGDGQNEARDFEPSEEEDVKNPDATDGNDSHMSDLEDSDGLPELPLKAYRNESASHGTQTHGAGLVKRYPSRISDFHGDPLRVEAWRAQIEPEIKRRGGSVIQEENIQLIRKHRKDAAFDFVN